MEEPKPTRKRVYRLRKLTSEIATTLVMLDKIAADEKQSPSKRAAAVFTRAELLMTVYSNQSEEQRAKWKHAIEDPKDKPKDEPKTPPGSTQVVPKEPQSLSFEERLAKRIEQSGGTA
jgi:hypothetical protein